MLSHSLSSCSLVECSIWSNDLLDSFDYLVESHDSQPLSSIWLLDQLDHHPIDFQGDQLSDYMVLVNSLTNYFKTIQGLDEPKLP